MDRAEPRGTVKKVAVVSLIVTLLCLACAAVIGKDEATFQIQRANNILRRWTCPAGAYSTSGGRNGNCLCKKCPLGRRCVGGNNPPRRCRHGTFQDTSGQNTCKASPPGSYVPNTGASKATKCPKGTYQPRAGQRACISSSAGNFVGQSGATGQVKCPRGTFTNARRQVKCTKCRVGHRCNGVGLKNPIPCDLGTYQNLIGQVTCKACPVGNSCPSRGLTRPRACRANKFQHCNGQMTCIPCPQGSASLVGSARCLVTQAFRPMGCLMDSRSRILRAKHFQSRRMSTQLCANTCAGYRYFGTQASGWCFCGNRFHGRMARSNRCNQRCSGNPKQICGGPWAMTTYRRY